MVDQGDIPIVYYTFNEGDGNIVAMFFFWKQYQLRNTWWPPNWQHAGTMLELYIIESTKYKK